MALLISALKGVGLREILRNTPMEIAVAYHAAQPVRFFMTQKIKIDSDSRPELSTPEHTSFDEVDLLVREILLSCNGGRVLCLGQGARAVVLGFLRQGVEAFGLEATEVGADEANRVAPGRFRSGVLSQLPFKDNEFSLVVVMESATALSAYPPEKVVSEIVRVMHRSLYFRLTHDAGSSGGAALRSEWEIGFFASGLRKHPFYYRVNAFEALENQAGCITLLLERMPNGARARYSLAALAEERDLHMDMLRESGVRSDAHVARYEWATSYVRPGDTVLDAACGLGYGSYLLQTGSLAARTIGIDGSRYAIDYANENFAAITPSLEFREGFLPDALACIPDHSVDLVVSFETLEHVDANDALLAEFCRILTPAGRIIASVPNDWSDETGEDPNPFHLHVYTLDRLRQEIGQHFLLDGLVAQSASQHKIGPGRKQWASAGRSFRAVRVDVQESDAPDAEWWLCVAMRSPIDGESIPYRETQFPVFEQPTWNVTAFGRDYRNPWLIRGMIDITHRLHDRSALVGLAERVLSGVPSDAHDAGAALCVIGYQMLEVEALSYEEVEQFARRVDFYLQGLPQTPLGVRWRISLLFVLGKLWMGRGNFSAASLTLERCVELDPMRFSPLLCNRTVEARLLLGVISVGMGRKDVAADHWRAGIRQARDAVTCDWRNSVGVVERPVEFGLPELASILEYASSCAYALAHHDEMEIKPGSWLQSRRDRLSQSNWLRSELESLKVEHSKLLKELDAYRRQAKDYRMQLDGAQEQLQNLVSYIELRDQEVTAFQEQSRSYAAQLKDAEARLWEADARLHKAADYSKLLVAELGAYQRQADEYVRQISASEVERERLARVLNERSDGGK